MISPILPPIPPIPFPPQKNGLIVKILKMIGTALKTAWDVITGKDERQDKIAQKNGVNPEKCAVDELAELNQLLVEYRKGISAAANDMERDMIAECSLMLDEIMQLFEEQNSALKIVRSDSITRKFKRICEDLKGTFADCVNKRISLDDAECVKIMKLPAAELKSQPLQKMKQKVFVEAGNEIVNRIQEAIQDFMETVEDAFSERLDRITDEIDSKTGAFEKLSKVSEDNTEAVENVIMNSDYLIAACSFAETLV